MRQFAILTNIKGRGYWHDALLFISAVALYAPSLRYGFVGDDLIYFIGNQHIESFDVMTILSSGAIGADYLPLRDLSFALDYYIWGADPFAFHLTNILLYGVTAIGVRHLFLLMHGLAVGQQTAEAETMVFLATLLFVLHPTHRNVVCAVYNRGALLTVLFCIVACICFIKYLRGNVGRHLSYGAALACYVLALMSREYGIVLPLLLVMLVFFSDRARRQAHLISTAPFFLAGAIFFGIYKKFAVAANFIQPSTDTTISDVVLRLSVAIKIAVLYLLRMFTHDVYFDDLDGFICMLVSGGILAVAIAAAMVYRRKYPQLLVGALFYLIGLIPVLNFYETYPVVALRYAYLPTLGLFLVITAISFKGWRRLVPLSCIAALALWSVFTVQQLNIFKDNVTHWENIVTYLQTPFSYTQLGNAYYAEERYDLALLAYRQVRPVTLDPEYHTAVGNSCLQLGDYECAVDSLETAIFVGARDSSVALNLAKAYLALGDRSNADKYLDYVSVFYPNTGVIKDD